MQRVAEQATCSLLAEVSELAAMLKTSLFGPASVMIYNIHTAETMVAYAGKVYLNIQLPLYPSISEKL